MANSLNRIEDEKVEGGLATVVTTGVAWIGGSQLIIQLLRFLATAVLARLLLPSDFGVVGMAVIVTGLVTMVCELGLSAAMVQREELKESHLVTSLWTSLTTGVVLCLATIALSHPIALFFGEAIVRPVVATLSFSFILSSMSTVQRALLQKRMQFKQLAFSQIGGELAFGAVGISLALRGLGVWALVVGILSRHLVQSLLLWLLCPWRPSGPFHWRSFRELFSFGANVLGGQLLNFLGANLDYLIVGRILGATPLGYYTLAFELTMFPRARIASMVTRVAFPAFSAIQRDNPRLRKGYTTMIAYLSLATFPLVVGLFAVAPEFILVIFGTRWTPVILPLQVLCMGGLMASIGTTVGSILKAKGRPDLELKMNLLSVTLLGLAIGIGVRHGIVGVAAAVSLKTLFLAWLFAWITNSLIGLGFMEYLRALQPASIAVAAMLLFLLGYRALASPLLSNTALLLSSIPLGAIVYFGTLKGMRAKAMEELIRLLWGTVGSPVLALARRLTLSK